MSSRKLYFAHRQARSCVKILFQVRDVVKRWLANKVENLKKTFPPRYKRCSVLNASRSSFICLYWRICLTFLENTEVTLMVTITNSNDSVILFVWLNTPILKSNEWRWYIISAAILWRWRGLASTYMTIVTFYFYSKNVLVYHDSCLDPIWTYIRLK